MRFDLQKAAIDSQEIGKRMLNSADVKIIATIITILQPFDEATRNEF